MPFLVFSGTLLAGKASSVRLTDIGGGTKIAGGSVFFPAYFILSAVAAIGLVVPIQFLRWQSAAIGAATPTALIPCCVWMLLRSARSSRHRGHSPAKATSCVRRGQIVALGLASLFWWSILSIFLLQVLGGVFQSWDAQRRYVATPGRVIESRLKSYPPTGRRTARATGQLSFMSTRSMASCSGGVGFIAPS